MELRALPAGRSEVSGRGGRWARGQAGRDGCETHRSFCCRSSIKSKDCCAHGTARRLSVRLRLRLGSVRRLRKVCWRTSKLVLTRSPVAAYGLFGRRMGARAEAMARRAGSSGDQAERRSATVSARERGCSAIVRGAVFNSGHSLATCRVLRRRRLRQPSSAEPLLFVHLAQVAGARIGANPGRRSKQGPKLKGKTEKRAGCRGVAFTSTLGRLPAG